MVLCIAPGAACLHMVLAVETIQGVKRILKNRWQQCGADRRGKLTQGDSASPRIVSRWRHDDPSGAAQPGRSLRRGVAVSGRQLAGDRGAARGQGGALTEENTRLKGLKGRPNLKPSGMEKGTDPSPPPSGRAGQRQRRREPRPPKSARLIVDEDRVVPQPGWRFKGFKVYTVQDLVVETCATGGRATGRRRVS